jgi:tetratricopeptide (TPR) repeat protein
VLTFAQLVEKRPDVRSSIQPFEREIHQSIGLIALYNGLLFVFDGFRLTPGQMLEEAAGLASRFRQMSERFGIELRPPERFVDEAGQAFLRANFPDKAVDLLKFNVEAHPASFNAHQRLAQAYVTKGDVSLAIEHYEKALQLDPANEEVKTRIRELASLPE